jgi:hypothetical protein
MRALRDCDHRRKSRRWRSLPWLFLDLRSNNRSKFSDSTPNGLILSPKTIDAQTPRGIETPFIVTNRNVTIRLQTKQNVYMRRRVRCVTAVSEIPMFVAPLQFFFLSGCAAFPASFFDHPQPRASVFDSVAQHINVTGPHAYEPPGPNDFRGPCPGLNSLANHNFIPHNGVVTLLDSIGASFTGTVYSHISCLSR